MNPDIEKNLFVVTDEDSGQILGNAFIAGGRLVTASHVVGYIGNGLLEDGNYQREPFYFEDRLLGDPETRQDLAVSKKEIGILGFSVADRGLRPDEDGKVITFCKSDFLEIRVKGLNWPFGSQSLVQVCDREVFIGSGMSGSVVLNFHGEAIGPLVGSLPGGKIGLVEHISR